jgi:hypothetical protein
MTMNDHISFKKGFGILGFGAPLTVENDFALVPDEYIEELEPFEGHVKPYLRILLSNPKAA